MKNRVCNDSKQQSYPPRKARNDIHTIYESTCSTPGHNSLPHSIPGEAMASSPDKDRHEHHRIVAEDIDHFHRDRVSALLRIGVRRGDQFQAAVATGAEALPLVFEDVAAGPAFFIFNRLIRCRLSHFFT